MYSRIYSSVCCGIEGRTVFAETDITRGLPGISIVGLPSAMVMESRERIKSAIINSGFDFPRGRITVNLTPASLRKNGSCLDLPIAVGILSCNGYIDPEASAGWGLIGELTLDGRILGVDGALPMIFNMRDKGLEGMIVPAENIREARIAGGNIHTASTLQECVRILGQRPSGSELHFEIDDECPPEAGDYGEIVGQENAKRAIVVAAAGGHGLLMIGSPGCGKTMLASRMPGILPEMNEREMVETAIIRSVSGRRGDEIKLSRVRPFRAPHHSIGRAGLIGGGYNPVPGEITLAHNGVLFLDEVCEFDRYTIESLRIPMEEKVIEHFRKGESYRFPCNCQIVMAANPCPCGYLGDRDHECTCARADIERYRRKLSGPLTDRMDISISMEKVSYSELTGTCDGLNTKTMRDQVMSAREFALASGRTVSNGELKEKELREFCSLGKTESTFMKNAYERFGMSPRAYKRTLRVARTIADLDKSKEIRRDHLAEALNYRIKMES